MTPKSIPRNRKLAIPFVLALLLAAACAPVTGPTDRTVSSELERTATMAYHRMEIAYLQTGGYTTNALVDLELPRGVMWTLEDFGDGTYRLRFTDDARPGEEWIVTPEGVQRASGA